MGRVKMKYNKYNYGYNLCVDRILLYERYTNLLTVTSMKDISKFIHSK